MRRSCSSHLTWRLRMPDLLSCLVSALEWYRDSASSSKRFTLAKACSTSFRSCSCARHDASTACASAAICSALDLSTCCTPSLMAFRRSPSWPNTSSARPCSRLKARSKPSMSRVARESRRVESDDAVRSAATRDFASSTRWMSSSATRADSRAAMRLDSASSLRLRSSSGTAARRAVLRARISESSVASLSTVARSCPSSRFACAVAVLSLAWRRVRSPSRSRRGAWSARTASSWRVASSTSAEAGPTSRWRRKSSSRPSSIWARARSTLSGSVSTSEASRAVSSFCAPNSASRLASSVVRLAFRSASAAAFSLASSACTRVSSTSVVRSAWAAAKSDASASAASFLATRSLSCARRGVSAASASAALASRAATSSERAEMVSGSA
mmetsp:Transcript_20216/g.63882  ORF Transcript_20216/g.63882 Transcript_20216/m.63882 type:complete len:387 (-) Transcript_20216:778-1938(-)